MTIEEKAKRYDEAIKKAEPLHKAAEPMSGCNVIIETLFPELKESEDERIRKSLIKYFTEGREYLSLIPYDKEHCVAWLEKQSKALKVEESMHDVEEKAKAFTETHKGETSEEILAQMKGEQNPTDKVEPKFHEGDWVVSPNGVYWHIDKISNNRYEVTSNTGKGSGSWNLDTNIYHKFTIQDAKDGDVLSYRHGQWIFIYKGFGKEENEIAYYALLSDEGLTLKNYNYSVIESAFSPATKEERDTLEKAMSDAGYTFNFEKKELKKIEQKPADKIEPKFKVGDKIQYLKGCGTIMTIEKIENGEYIFGNNLGHTTIEDGNKWYLVERNPIWSEDDEIGLCDALWCIKQASRIAKDENEMGNCWYAENWLKSLKERMQPHPKQEWSEEDNIILSRIIADYEKSNEEWFNAQKSLPHGRKITWLKSLRPQNRWKPSDKQMLAINTAINVIGKGTLNGRQLIKLREELQKLREQ